MVRVLVIFIVVVVMGLAGWFFFVRDIDLIRSPVQLPVATQQQPPSAAEQKPSEQQQTDEAAKAAKRLAEIRAKRQAEEEREGFREPPQIKLPQEGAKEKPKGGGGIGDAWDKLTFPVRAIGWVMDNFWVLLALFILVWIFFGKILGGIIKAPLVIFWEIFQTLFLHQSIIGALNPKEKTDKDSADGGGRRRRRK